MFYIVSQKGDSRPRFQCTNSRDSPIYNSKLLGRLKKEGRSTHMIVRGVVPYPSRQRDITVMFPFTKKAPFIEMLYLISKCYHTLNDSFYVFDSFCGRALP